MENSENRAVIDVMERLSNAKLLPLEPHKAGEDGRFSEEARFLFAVPKGMELKSAKAFLDEYRTAPERKNGTAIFSRLESFIEHANRFKNEHSAVFVNEAAPSIVSVIDYHEPKNGSPRFGDHRGSYTFPLAPEWHAWTKQDGEAMSQADFAAFLEDRVLDIMAPENVGQVARDFATSIGIKLANQAQVMTLSRGLTVRVGANVVQHQNLSSGEAQLGYEETHHGNDGSPLNVPGGFVIALPVFQGGALYQVPVRLRYRVKDRGITWWFALSRINEIRLDAIREAVERVAKETELPVFYGQPEAGRG